MAPAVANPLFMGYKVGDDVSLQYFWALAVADALE